MVMDKKFYTKKGKWSYCDSIYAEEIESRIKSPDILKLLNVMYFYSSDVIQQYVRNYLEYCDIKYKTKEEFD